MKSIAIVFFLLCVSALYALTTKGLASQSTANHSKDNLSLLRQSVDSCLKENENNTSSDSFQDIELSRQNQISTRNANSLCQILIEGKEGSKVKIMVDCEGYGPVNKTVDYLQNPEQVPNTTELGFQLFTVKQSRRFAISINEGANVQLRNVEIRHLNNFGAVFRVENAQLSIDGGTFEDIQESSIAALAESVDSTLYFKSITCKDVQGSQAGVLVANRSKIEIKNSRFKDTRSEQKSMVFFITDHSELSLVDSACSGPLPRVDNHMQRLLLPEMNIEVESADAGVAFVTGKSKLTMEKVLFENYPSIRGTIFLEDSSRLFCEDSEIVNSLALYGGAMYSEDSEIVLNNAWIHKTASSRGGAILLHGLSSCDLQNSTFESNYAIQGGALFIEIDECSFKKESNLPAKISITGCSFNKNLGYADGGAIFSSCLPLSLKRCSFTDNEAVNRGGAIFVNASSQTEISDVTFFRNSATKGGALFLDVALVKGNLNLEKTSFEKNSATEGNGGAIYFDGKQSTLKTIASDFISNEAYRYGGALYLEHVIQVHITGDTFSNNIALRGSGGSIDLIQNEKFVLEKTSFEGGQANFDGGEISVEQSSSMVVNQVTFSKSKAGDNGGAIFMASIGTLSMTNTMMQNCKAGKNGGGFSFERPLDLNSSIDAPRLLLLDTELISNNGSSGGGGYVSSVDYFQFESCQIANNRATNGGGIWVRNVTSLTFFNIQAKENKATSNGGAFHISQTKSLNMNISVFEANVAEKDGGAFFCDQIPMLQISDSLIKENTASKGTGGGFTIFGTQTFTIDRSAFMRNGAGHSGGAIAIERPLKTEFTNMNFTSNFARNGNGGALCFMNNSETYASSTSLQLLDVHFDSDQAGSHGGALYLHDLDELNTKDSAFINCSALAGKGGSAYLSNITELEIDDADIEKSTSRSDGGALFLQQISTVTLKATFISCTSFYGKGGAMFLHNEEGSATDLSSKGAVLTSNSATQGGGYYIRQIRRALLDGSMLYYNSATAGSGGALDIAQVSEVSLLSVFGNTNTATESCGVLCLSDVGKVNISGKFDSNAANGKDGGSVLMQRIGAAVIEGSFENNQAYGNGGAISIQDSQEIEIRGVQILLNSAKRFDGGGIHMASIERINIHDANFSQNAAGSNGGGMALLLFQKSKIDILNCSFTSNAAGGNGGGFVISTIDDQNAIINPKHSSQIQVNSTSFQSNKAKNGGGTAIETGSCIFSECGWTGNAAKHLGGGLYLDNKHSSIIVNDSNIDFNEASEGGAVFVTCDTQANKTGVIPERFLIPRRILRILMSNEMQQTKETTAGSKFVKIPLDQEWYFYIIFILGGYGILLLFLTMAFYLFKRWAKSFRRGSVIVYRYSDIGEVDPEAVSFERLFPDVQNEYESDDEPIVPPKPMPMMSMTKPAHFSDADRISLQVEIDEDENGEGSLKEVGKARFD